MSKESTIGWTNASWNPVTGCTRVSAGCQHCYAETFANRWKGIKGHYFEEGFKVLLRPDKLAEPLKWSKPRKIFVNSMSDIFHKEIPDSYIDKIFGVMASLPQHTFQILTKRPQRMVEYFQSHRIDLAYRWAEGAKSVVEEKFKGTINENVRRQCTHFGTKLPNVWMGVSVEDQWAADQRIPLLLGTPVAVRWVSCEPLLEEVNLNHIECNPDKPGLSMSALHEQLDGCFYNSTAQLDWVVVGGESGPGCRPMNFEWARSLKNQCQGSEAKFFMKQLGGTHDKREDLEDLPEDLRIREYPNSSSSGELF